MTIADSMGKGKGLLARIPRDFLIILVILLVATASFGLGILAGRDLEKQHGGGVWIEQVPLSGTTTAVAAPTAPAAPMVAIPAPATQQAAAAVPVLQAGAYVGSVNGKSYYSPDCAGAKRIKPENKVWFLSKADAVSRGYSPSKTCKGL